MTSYNIPSYTTSKFSYGPGLLYLGATGSTPSVDIGGVRSGAELAITRTVLEVRQGSSQALVKQYVTQEAVQLTVRGIEWNIENLVKALGTGTTSTAGGYDVLGFGSDINMAEVAVMFEHTLPTGKKLYVDLWKASPAGEITVTFGDDLHEFPYVFKALDCATDWAGGAISDNRRLMRVRLEQ